MLAGLMRHSVDVYRPAEYDAGDTDLNAYADDPAVTGLRCNIQPAISETIAEYRSRDEDVSLTMYWITADTVGIDDKVVWLGEAYRVVGRKGDTQRNRWSRADLQMVQI